MSPLISTITLTTESTFRVIHTLSTHLSHAFASAAPEVAETPVEIGESMWHALKHAWRQDVLLMVEDRLPKVAVVLLLLFLAQRLVRFFVSRMQRAADRTSGATAAASLARSAQLRTMAAIIRATSYSVLAFLAFLQILNLVNINYGPLLASAGIIGVGIGLAAQSLFKDMINGVLILLENQYNVGEVIKVASLTGTVEDLSLRATRLRDGDGTLYVIPNSQISTVSNLSRDFAVGILNVTVDASANPDRIIAILSDLSKAIGEDKAFAPILLGVPSVLGVDKLDGRSVVYPIALRVYPLKKDDVMRELRRRIVLRFLDEGIPMGVDANMLVTKAMQADPTAPPAQQPLVGS